MFYPVCLRRNVKATPHVLWFDNFSKNMAWQLPGLDKGIWNDGMWCGYALRQVPFEINMSLIEDLSGNVLPAMPENPLTEIPTFFSNMEKLAYGNAPAANERYLKSNVVRWKVRNVPPHPRANLQLVPVKYREALQAHLESMEHLYTEKITKHNTASRVGLSAILREIYEEKGLHLDDGHEDKATTYCVINTDVNIYDRLMKVKYRGVGGQWCI